MPQIMQPKISVDIIIRYKGGVVLIKRKNPPLGWALPGGFVEYGETLEGAAIREAKEETNLNVQLERQFHAYSDPKRDSRHHTITVVFIAEGRGELKAGDDAAEATIFPEGKVPQDIVFDHKQILLDYFNEIY